MAKGCSPKCTHAEDCFTKEEIKKFQEKLGTERPLMMPDYKNKKFPKGGIHPQCPECEIAETKEWLMNERIKALEENKKKLGI